MRLQSTYPFVLVVYLLVLVLSVATVSAQPTPHSFFILDNEGYTNDHTPEFFINASGADLFYLSCDEVNYTSAIPFTNSYDEFDITEGSFGCLSGEGTKSVSILFENSSTEELAGPLSVSTVLDTVPPTLSTVFVATSFPWQQPGQPFFNSPFRIVAEATDLNLSHVTLRSNFNGSMEEYPTLPAFTDQYYYEVAGNSTEPGRLVFYEFKATDKAGNIAHSTYENVTIYGSSHFIIPDAPNGCNDWYTTLPGIFLSSTPSSPIYYRWDGFDQNVRLYNGSVNMDDNAPGFGIEKLYYWSEVGNITEPLNELLIGIDRFHPVASEFFPEEGAVLYWDSINFSAKLSDTYFGNSGIDINKTTFSIDGHVVDKSEYVHTDKNFALFNQNLSEGEHYVKLDIEDHACLSRSFTWTFTIDLSAAPTFSILTPLNGSVIDERKFLLTVNATDVVDLEYALNRDRYARLCSDCALYNKTRIGKEGLNTLSVRSTDRFGRHVVKNISFVVDSKAPKVRKYTPRRNSHVGEFVNFSLLYTEDNLLNLTLRTNLSAPFDTIPFNCTSGTNVWCSALVDFDYQGDLMYHFVLSDEDHVTKTKKTLLHVDTITPSLFVHSPANGSIYSSKRVLFDIAATEDVLVTYELNGREYRLCSHCDTIQRNKNFKDGLYKMKFAAVDKSGNNDSSMVEFTVESTPPKVRRTLPKPDIYRNLVNFSVTYDETASLDTIRLLLLSNGGEISALSIENFTLSNCTMGRGATCGITLNLSEYDGDLSYQFEISDANFVVLTEAVDLTIDNIAPNITIVAPLNGSNVTERRTFVTATLDETVAKVERVLNGKTRTVCRNCDSLNRRESFKDGNQTITLIATDYAGNVGTKNVTFEVNT